MNDHIRGVLPVIHMPYNEDLGIDDDALQRQIDWLFDVGADGFCLALVSDTLRLTAGERLQLPEKLVAWAGRRGPVIISVGAESTVQACEYARAAASAGAAAVMAIPPMSQGCSEVDLRGYFEAILAVADIPVFVQDASTYVGQTMSLDFQAALFEDYGERIFFKPEAAPLGRSISALRDKTAGRAAIFEGSGGVLLIDAYRRGIAGTIPGVELLDGLVELWQALERGDEERAYRIYYPICALATLQLQGGLDGFIVVERYLMHRRGVFSNQIHRGPLSYRLDEETRAEIDRLYYRLQDVL